MKYRSRFPEQVEIIEHTWIPMSDSVRLSARIFLPKSARKKPVPAILEYIPYRHRDNTRVRDTQMHKYFAGYGYASIRVDIRGSGNSEGVLLDEYLQSELEDGIEIINWISKQPWCDGNVGMIGISWGGFNGLQIAALRPQPLKAIITVCSSDDRYSDDVHHMGGCLLGDNLSWASTMFGLNSLPPDPEIVGDSWRDMWFERLRGSGLWLEKWLRHQKRDEYWEHGSVCENWDSIKIPVMAVSGWADGYTDAVFRILENLKAPKLGLVGPWSHKYPHQGVPGPAIGFLQEALRWWDKWLKNEESGIMEEPLLRSWIMEKVPAIATPAERKGRWVAERNWPSENITLEKFSLIPGQLIKKNSNEESHTLTVQSPLSVGFFAGKWCSYAAAPDLPHDQREEDGGALVFDTPPLEETVEILGKSEVVLNISASNPLAMVAARISDVSPDGKATRVTYGLLNLCHRDNSKNPELLEPGKNYKVTICLNDVGYKFVKGNKIRLSISSSYWPLAWPPPASTRLTIETGGSSLFLPVRHDNKTEKVSFKPPEAATPPQIIPSKYGEHSWKVIRNLGDDHSILQVINDDGILIIPEINLEYGRCGKEYYSYTGDDFASPRGEAVWEWKFKRGKWDVKTITRTVLTSDEEKFCIYAQLDAFEGDKRVFSKNWDTHIKRDYI